MKLAVRELEVDRGPTRVLNGLSLSIHDGEVVGIAGQNGAGKSTLLHTIAGLIRPSGGAIEFDAQRIEGLSPQRLLRMGLALVPQGRRVFSELTVHQNLTLGGFVRRENPAAKQAAVDELLERYPALARRAAQPAGTLSGGEQGLLVLGRALMARPRVLLLDEPLMGLAGGAVEMVLGHVRECARSGMAVVVVEHNRVALASVADRLVTLVEGRISWNGR